MEFPQIDAEKCRKDGLCTRVCPSNRLGRGPAGAPFVHAQVPCLSCGHCVAICPSMAIRLESTPTEELEPLPNGWQLDANRVRGLLKGRRSTRVYREETLDRATIEQLIQTAQYAPSGHNSQPLNWLVVSRPAVTEIAEATVRWMREAVAQGSPYVNFLNMPAVLAAWDSGDDPICRRAPHLLIASAPEQLPTGAHAAAIAITYLELAAVSLGLGTCWAGFVFVGAGVSPELHAALGLPPGQKCAGAVLVGKPAVTYRRVPVRRAPTIHWR